MDRDARASVRNAMGVLPLSYRKAIVIRRAFTPAVEDVT